jgi:pimeloyl-ACP methyl ester carboxylesterase
MWLRLSEHTHLVAVDLPGFGRSQRRDALMSPRAMGEFIIRAADAFGLEHPHVVGPDVGTSASLFAAALHPGRLRSLVVGSGGEASTSAPNVAAALTGIERYELPDHVRDDYVASYDGDRFAESMRYLRTYPTELPALGELLPQIQTPVQIIVGSRETAGPLNGEFLHERLPNSTLAILDAGHFTWEDAADDYAALVTSWWSAGGR